MSKSAVVPYRTGERLLMAVVAILILLVAEIALRVGEVVTSGVRPDGSEVQGVMVFATFTVGAIGVVLPLARRFDARHVARLERVADGTRSAWSRSVAKLRSMRPRSD